MAGRKKSLVEEIQGEHLSLCVAAHLGRTQLVANPLAPYDAKHLMEIVEAVARALARVAPLYVRDSASSEPRELSTAELEGATITEGANLIVLKDGRRLTRVSLKRVDLRQAIALLKATGVPGLGGPQVHPREPAPASPRLDIAAQIAKVEALLRPPLERHRVERATRALVSLARNAAGGRVSNLAMQLISAAQASNDDAVTPLLAELRAALADEEEKG